MQIKTNKYDMDTSFGHKIQGSQRLIIRKRFPMLTEFSKNCCTANRVIYKADLRSYDRAKSQMIGQNLLARSS